MRDNGAQVLIPIDKQVEELVEPGGDGQHGETDVQDHIRLVAVLCRNDDVRDETVVDALFNALDIKSSSGNGGTKFAVREVGQGPIREATKL